MLLSQGGCTLPSHGCGEGLELIDGRCVASSTRYEPGAPLDRDNVVSFADEPLGLVLPEPPRAGFRLVMAPVDLAPGEERVSCVSWPFPPQARSLIYSAQMMTTVGLHHSNVFSPVLDPVEGPNPHPECRPGADDAFARIELGVPDVLFANSTQVEGGEWLTFPAGMAYRFHPDREVVASVHLLNSGAEPMRAEVVYDFYTMPDDKLEQELAPFAMDNQLFEVPPNQTQTTTASCAVGSGQLVSLMPHTHQFSERFSVDVIGAGGGVRTIYDDEGFDRESDIAVLSPPVVLEHELRYSCTFANTKSEPLVYGLGDQEMCILFGYMFPVEEQFVAFQYGESGCTTLKLR
jgi:hypothetical protein